MEVNIPFEFQICEGKVVCPGTLERRILNLSSGGMFPCTLGEIEHWLNTGFRLEFNILGVQSSDIYGKVLRARKEAELYEMNIEFTAMNPEDRNTIKELVNQVIQSRFEPRV